MPTLARGTVLLLLLASAPTLSAQADIEDQLKPSVVLIRNEECFGSGMFLNDQGLILTNAHVACSPLPYAVYAYARVGGKYQDVVFKKATLLGFHPDYDLALLKIDPAECDAKIQPVKLATAPPVRGERCWAIGFPSDLAKGYLKITTWGEVRTAQHDFFDQNYYELDISVTHGNSGGPACNKAGEVIGVITMLIKNRVLATPISAYKPDRFGPLKERSPNREISTELVQRAEALNPGGRGVPPPQSMMYYEMALLWDSGNAALYSKIGQLNLQAGRPSAAAAYLVRSLRIQPWSDSSETYRSLGLALAGMQRPGEALNLWEEGLRKFPADNAQLWGEFAVALERERHYYEAALSARIAIKTFSNNSGPVNQAYKRSVENLAGADLNRLLGVENDLDAHLARLRAAADKAHGENRPFLLPEAEKLVKFFDGIQDEIVAADVGRLVAPPLKPLEVSDQELTARFIHNRIDVAKENIKSGQNQKAIDILEDVILNYPKHPESDSARLLLRFLKK